MNDAEIHGNKIFHEGLASARRAVRFRADERRVVGNGHFPRNGRITAAKFKNGPQIIFGAGVVNLNLILPFDLHIGVPGNGVLFTDPVCEERTESG